MATRKDIVVQLRDDIKKIKKAGKVYKQDVMDVRIGILNPDKFKTLPAIGLLGYDDVVEEELMDDDMLRKLRFIAYGYIGVNDYDDYESLYDFTLDFEKFLNSTDNTYKKETHLLNTTIKYGGIKEMIGYFVIFFDIDYYQTDF